MTPSLPPVPGGPNAAPAPTGPPAGLTGLVGGVPTATPIGPTPEQKVQAFMEQIRNLHMTIDALAQDHPEAGEDLNEAKNALTNSMSKVATNVSSPETGPQPPTF